MNSQIQGIVPPMITPFRSDGSIDEQALRSDVKYLIEEAGVDGLAVCGSTGEGHTLNTQETRQITAAAIDEVAGRAPVITGIIADSTATIIERGLAVRDLGVAALQVTPVHYLFRPDDDAMVRFFQDICAATETPVILYNVVPWTYLSPQLLRRIIREVDGVIGVKQSAGDLKMLADLLLLASEDAVIMSAVDALLYPSFALGAHGAIAAILTAVPELCVSLWSAVREGNHVKAGELHKKLLIIWNAMVSDNLPAGVRCCMELQGRNGGIPRLPMAPASPEKKTQIQDAMRKAEVID